MVDFSKVCSSSVSAWLGVFASIAMSSASVIVFSGYLLRLLYNLESNYVLRT